MSVELHVFTPNPMRGRKWEGYSNWSECGTCRMPRDHRVHRPDPLIEDLTVALNRALAAFTSMFAKVLDGTTTWSNLQSRLTEDEYAVFLAFLNMGKPGGHA